MRLSALGKNFESDLQNRPLKKRHQIELLRGCGDLSNLTSKITEILFREKADGDFCP
jgi:hypothetical protein